MRDLEEMGMGMGWWKGTLVWGKRGGYKVHGFRLLGMDGCSNTFFYFRYTIISVRFCVFFMSSCLLRYGPALALSPFGYGLGLLCHFGVRRYMYPMLSVMYILQFCFPFLDCWF